MKQLLYTAGLLITCFGYSQNSACANFKEGTFKMTDPKSKKVCIITRKGNIQTERMEESDETYEFDLTWVDNCTYTITPTPATAARRQETLEPGVMTVRIIKAADSSYTSKVTVANNPRFRRIDQVTVVKKD